MKIIQLHEQLLENTLLPPDAIEAILLYMEDGQDVVHTVKRGRKEKEPCIHLFRKDNKVYATSSYFVGLDWLAEKELAVQINPKMNDGFEIDYVHMLNDALCEPENFEHLKDLITIRFDKPSIQIKQQQDFLSIFLITEFLGLLQKIVRKGLKKSFYMVEENLPNKVKGKILIGKNVHQNLTKGKITNNVCKYQVYDIDSDENRILKKALRFCKRQLIVYSHAIDTHPLETKAKYIQPYFDSVSDNVSIRTIKSFKGNPIFKEYNQAVEFAQLLLRRYSYDITNIGKQQISTPPFWIDMSKLFELYIFHHLRKVFTDKNEIRYHVNAHFQELDYLLNPSHWSEPYVIDAKYKPRYKHSGGISIDDAREVSGYARLSSIYSALKLDENKVPPIKCLIIYPDQEQEERFTFTNIEEPTFEAISGYVRFYKIGIRLPMIIQNG